MPHVSSNGGEDLASTDEVKVYTEEGEEEKTPENLAEDKEGLVTETEEVFLSIFKVSLIFCAPESV